ncbi:family 43 glycosylhydrolase [Streptomyces sp. NPDC059262]|uniref:family 43 glycosylhydrolase n=1 Tax=Streptomyces sp. NPDC059262 TaxID=3346797 RepID=UPI0036B632FC
MRFDIRRDTAWQTHTRSPPEFHPNPSVCRVGDDYYLTRSSFEYVPGVPLFHNRDLMHWRQIGNVLDRPGQLRLPWDTPSSAGIYAPTLRHHDGRFWLVATNVSSGGGNLLVSATDPAGPWSDPVPLPGVPGIDPDLAWEEDGACWVTVAGISQVRIDPYTGETFGEPRPLWCGTPGAKAPEAPHLYHVGDHWYLLIAEGGTERGHAVSVARGPAPTGPFEPCPANPVLTHRSTDEPLQNTGHADLVQAPDGTWWTVFLGVRPRGGTPGWHVLGRETFLAPVTWEDGWPVVGPPVTAGPAPASAMDTVAAMQHSWNLGNTLDAIPDETSWGNPPVAEALFDTVGSQGFRSVRIPVTWGNHQSDQAPYTIDAAFLSRVRQVADWAQAVGRHGDGHRRLLTGHAERATTPVPRTGVPLLSPSR